LNKILILIISGIATGLNCLPQYQGMSPTGEYWNFGFPVQWLFVKRGVIDVGLETSDRFHYGFHFLPFLIDVALWIVLTIAVLKAATLIRRTRSRKSRVFSA